MLAHVLLHESDGIVSMSWNCPDFLVEDSTESDTDSDDNVLPLGTTPPTLPSALQYLAIRLMCVLFLCCLSAQSQAIVDSHLSIRRH